jgi:hypothetical protein
VDEDQFWALIAQSRAEARGGGERLAEVLGSRLRQLSAEEILAFGQHWHAVHRRLFRWPIWDAATVLLGWVGDDSFRDVRAWIVSHGRSVVHQVVEDPDSLADLDEDRENAFVESFDGIDYKSYRAVAGHDPVYVPTVRMPDPAGERANLKDAAVVARRFPRLAELAQARKPAAPVNMSAVVWAPDESQRCPRCSQSLTRMSVGHAGLVDGVPAPQQEFRACTACFEFAVRTGGGDWAAIASDDSPAMARMTFRRP